MLNEDGRVAYFFVLGSPLQFKVCAVFQLSIDLGECNFSWLFSALADFCAVIVGQRVYYGNAPPANWTALPTEEDELEQALALAEEGAP